MKTRYLIALGSNQRHPQHGAPPQVLRAAMATLGRLDAVSPIITSTPLGPSRRRYANAALIVRSNLHPEAMLARLKTKEAMFGRKRGGQRWGARVLDLDIILWEGGSWSSVALTIPHTEFRHRAFVLGPAAMIAPRWRDPVTRLTLRQLDARLTKRRPLPIGAAW